MAACLTSEDPQGLVVGDDTSAKERLYCVVLAELLRYREHQSSRVHTRLFPARPVGALSFAEDELRELEGTGMYDTVAGWRRDVGEAYTRLVPTQPDLQVCEWVLCCSTALP